MLVYLLLFFYLVLYLFLSWKNFRWGLAILILALPTYLIRFEIWKLPTTLLEITFGALFFVWLVKYSREDRVRIKNHIVNNKWLFIFLALFFVGSVAGIFVSDMWWASLGQWRAYFLEPILLFFVLLGRKHLTLPSPQRGEGVIARCLPLSEGEIKRGCYVVSNDIIWFLLLSTVSISLVAILQKLTGQFYPPSLWNDQLFSRATSFFTTPNAIGLYLAPMVMLGVGVLLGKLKSSLNTGDKFFKYYNIKYWILNIIKISNIQYPIFLLLSLLAILFSFSQGAWIALDVGAVCLIYLLNYKKVAVAMVLVGLLAAFIVPSVRTAVLFEDQAGQNRLTLWRHSITYLTQSPKNFIFGAGIRQYFRKVEKPYYNPVEMERLIYPHNILLNFWVETGLLGVVGFVGLMVYGFNSIWKRRKENLIFSSCLITALVVLLVHGFVDVPYFKNDLAFLFWIMYGLGFDGV